MKAFIPILAISFLSMVIISCQMSKTPVHETTVQESVSDCINSTNRNLIKAEINLKRLENIRLVDSTKSTAKKEAIRFKTMLDGLDSSIVSCKNNEPDFDFTEIDQKVKELRIEYQKILNSLNEENN